MAGDGVVYVGPSRAGQVLRLLLAGFLLIYVAAYLVDLVEARGGFVQTLVQLTFAAIALWSLWTQRTAARTRVAFDGESLTIYSPGKPSRVYALDELAAWGNVHPPGEIDHARSAGELPLRIETTGGEEAVTLPAGHLGRRNTELRRALRGRLPFVDDLRTDDERSAGPEVSQPRSLALGSAGLLFGALMASHPLDMLLAQAHFRAEVVQARLTGEPEGHYGRSYASLQLPLSVDGAPDGVWSILADSTGVVDTAAVRGLAVGDELRLARGWWPGSTLSAWTSNSSRPLDAKRIYLGDEIIVDGVSVDEMPLTGWSVGMLVVGLAVFGAGGVGWVMERQTGGGGS